MQGRCEIAAAVLACCYTCETQVIPTGICCARLMAVKKLGFMQNIRKRKTSMFPQLQGGSVYFAFKILKVATQLNSTEHLNTQPSTKLLNKTAQDIYLSEMPRILSWFARYQSVTRVIFSTDIGSFPPLTPSFTFNT